MHKKQCTDIAWFLPTTASFGRYSAGCCVFFFHGIDDTADCMAAYLKKTQSKCDSHLRSRRYNSLKIARISIIEHRQRRNERLMMYAHLDYFDRMKYFHLLFLMYCFSILTFSILFSNNILFSLQKKYWKMNNTDY